MNEELTSETLETLIALYGDNARLMIEVRCTDNGQWHTLLSNSHVMACFDENSDGRYEFRLKESAALPFDLAAAKAGDVVEVDINGYWKVLYSLDNGFRQNNAKTRVNVIRRTGRVLGFKTNKLRMQHPRRVGVDYKD